LKFWKKYYSLIFLIVALGVTASNIIQKIYYSPDDTYIYMQYARNIAHGNGYSFNAGEPSYGVTSLFWPILMAPAYLAGMEGYWFAKILDLILFIMSIIIFYKLTGLMNINADQGGMLNNRNIQNISTAVFSLNIWFVRWAFTGMETSLAVFMVLLIFFFVYKEKYISASISLGIFYLIRPEGIVLFLVYFIFLIYKRVSVKVILYSCILFLVITVPFIVYAKIVFNTFVPNTAIGKTTFNFGLDIYLPELKRIFLTIFVSDAIGILLSILVIIYVFRTKKIKDYLFMILWIIGLICLYVVTDSDIISRYLLIIIPFFTIIGFQALKIYPARLMILSSILFIIILIQTQFIFYRSVKPATDNFTQGTNECLIAIGKWIDSSTPKESRVLVNDVGAIGYYSNRYIIDAAALINRDLELNRKIMHAPLEERQNTANLLKIASADYVILRDTVVDPIKINEKLEFKFYREFPGLGISDQKVKYYSVYRVKN